MRTIKFMGYDRKANRTFPIHNMNFNKITDELIAYYGVDIRDKDSDYQGDVSYGGGVSKLTGCPLMPRFELMEYIGQDDCKGKKIYTSFLVKGTSRSNAEWTTIHKVTFLNGCFMIGNWNAQEYFNRHTLIEIVGNEFQNPELMGVKA